MSAEDSVIATAPQWSSDAHEVALDRVHRSCASAVASLSDKVQIDDEAIKAFVSNLDASKIDAAPFKGYPLSFPSRFEEVNFIATTQLLNIGSGFREALHTATGRGAWDTIMFGCIGMYLSGRRLDADYFCNISMSDIESTFGIPLSVDKEISGPIKMSVAGPLKPLAQHIYYALTETGRVLRARGFASLGHMIYNVRSKYGESVAVPTLEPITASSLIERLTSAFKPFNDTATTSANSEVCFFKKAQLLCSQLYSRFKDDDRYFNFSDIDNLSLFADNVLPCMLRHFRILNVSNELSSTIEQGQPISGDDEIALRAGAVVAGDRIIAEAKQRGMSMSALSLDFYLWSVAKEGDARKLARHSNPNTFYY